MRRILNDVGTPQINPTFIKCDNQSALSLITNPGFHSRTKHISVRYHFVRSQAEQGEIRVSYTPTDTQLADIFTKPLHAPRFQKLRESIGVVELPM